MAGPQCNEVATQVSLQLTGNRNCWPGGKNRKQFMLDATVNAMAAGVDAMIEDGVQVAFVAPLATNIYAPGGTPQGKIAQWFGSADDFTRQVLAKVLNAAYKDGKPRGEHLQAVLPIFRRL